MKLKDRIKDFLSDPFLFEDYIRPALLGFIGAFIGIAISVLTGLL